ncbi:MAG: flagellar FliJ family protein [Nitrospira sp.]|nr:flagellar FliJ family protein [Nitrospira sp.]
MSLEALRKFRAQERETLMMELASVSRELMSLEQRCGMLEERLRTDASFAQRQAVQGVTAPTWLEWDERLTSQWLLLKQVQEAVRRLTDVWGRTRARLIEALQEGKVLDRLADRRQAEREALKRKQEQRTADDMASRRLFLNKRS